MERNKGILYRVLNGEKMSALANEYLVSNTFISYTVHRQVKKVMPELYGKENVSERYKGMMTFKPLMRDVIALKNDIIKKINKTEIDKMVHETKVRESTIRNAITVLEQEGYKVTKAN